MDKKTISPTATSGRLAWIDALRGLAIFFVVVGHQTSSPVFLKQYLYSFHMPLFFFISGFLFSPHKYPSLMDFARARARRLLIPYLSFSVITYAVWAGIGRHMTSVAAHREISVFKPLVGILYASDPDNWMPHNGVLWFVVCLFVTEILFFALHQRLHAVRSWGLVFLAVSLGGYFVGPLSPARWPWSADVALTALVFYGFGFFARPHVAKPLAWSFLKKAPWLLGMLLVSLTLTWWNGYVNMSVLAYAHYFDFYLMGLAGITFYLLLAPYLPAVPGLTYLGRHSLVILAFHFLTGSLTRALVRFATPWSVEQTLHSTVWMIIYPVVATLLCVPLILAIDRWFPFLLGKKRHA